MALYELKVTSTRPRGNNETLVLSFLDRDEMIDAQWELEKAGFKCRRQDFGTKTYRSADRAVSDALSFFS